MHRRERLIKPEPMYFTFSAAAVRAAAQPLSFNPPAPVLAAAVAQFVVEASTLVKTVVTTRREDVEAPLAVEKEPWELPKSIFAARAKRGPQQCDAKDYFDTPRVLESMFDADWAKLMAKVRPRCCRAPAAKAAMLPSIDADVSVSAKDAGGKALRGDYIE